MRMSTVSHEQTRPLLINESSRNLRESDFNLGSAFHKLNRVSRLCTVSVNQCFGRPYALDRFVFCNHNGFPSGAVGTKFNNDSE